MGRLNRWKEERVEKGIWSYSDEMAYISLKKLLYRPQDLKLEEAKNQNDDDGCPGNMGKA